MGSEMKPHVAYLDDGSILIEWICADARFAINLERRESESSWNYVSHYVQFYGHLPPEVTEALKTYFCRTEEE